MLIYKKMMLYNIVLINTGSGTKVYNENLPFRQEPTKDDIIDFMAFIRPAMLFDYREYWFIRDLKPSEK